MVFDLATIKYINRIKIVYDLGGKIREHKNNFLNGKGQAIRKYNPRWKGIFENGFQCPDFVLLHYGTPILKIEVCRREPKILPSIWNSMSDIQGVNKCLYAFNLQFRYSSIKGLVRY